MKTMKEEKWGNVEHFICMEENDTFKNLAKVMEEGKKELESVLTEEEYELITVGTEFKIKWFFLGEK